MIPFHIFYMVWIILGVIYIILLYKIHKQIYLIGHKPSFDILSIRPSEFFKFFVESVKIQKNTQDRRLKILLYLFFVTSFIAFILFFLGFFGIIAIDYRGFFTS